MKKRFNTTGACIPEEHYMVDISKKINQIMKMIEYGDYFVINCPRRFGKTTIISMLNRFLKNTDEYFPIVINFEEISEKGFKNTAAFIEELFGLLKGAFESTGNKHLFIEYGSIPRYFAYLGFWFHDLIDKIGKNVVLIIDNADKGATSGLFVDFLGLLRHEYLNRSRKSHTFHNVILAGVQNVTILDLDRPWNIAAQFNVDLGFSVPEIVTMLEEYVSKTGIEMDVDAMAKELDYYTSGYPYLISKLCSIIDEEIIVNENRTRWLPDDIEKAVIRLLKRPDNNFDNVINVLETDKELYDRIEWKMLQDFYIGFDIYISNIRRGVEQGIVRDGGPGLAIHNRLYKELIYNYMTEKFRKVLFQTNESEPNIKDFVDQNGNLDFKKVVFAFRKVVMEEFSRKDKDFMGKHHRLIFLAFIKPIINGHGYDFKEVQISEEKRLDVVITFDNRKYIIELKIWRGESYHQEGIRELCDYLDRQNQSNGYLLIFDLRKESGRIGKMETIETQGKTILAAWV
ncbi:MAG: AAA family ATPase [Candidatus Omnitrophota bacterium]